MFTAEQTASLAGPLDRSHVKTRNQSGRSLSYIEGWHAIAEANRIFGFDAWSSETVDIRCVSEGPRKMSSGEGFGVSYIARVRITIGTLVREGVGSGHGIDRDLGLAHESAIKEAETDARKRALMTFGNPFGLALYDKVQANVCDTPAPPKADSEMLTAAKATAQQATTKAELRTWMKTAFPGLRAALGDEEAAELKRFVVSDLVPTLPENDQTPLEKDAA